MKELENVKYEYSNVSEQEIIVTLKASIKLAGDYEPFASFCTEEAIWYLEANLHSVIVYDILNPCTVFNNSESNRHGTWKFKVLNKSPDKKKIIKRKELSGEAKKASEAK